MKINKVKATVVKIEGAKDARCAFGHKVGDEFTFDESGPDKKMCFYALETLLPAINVLLHGGKFPWTEKDDKLYWGCPHPGSIYEGMGQIIFELELISTEKA